MERLRKDVLNTMQHIRRLTPNLPVDPTQAKASEVWEGYYDGQSLKRVVIYLRSSGCFWSQPKAGVFKPGCLDCEHSLAQTTFGVPISSSAYMSQFKGEYDKYDFDQYPMLCLYNEGNFLNPKELPVDARQEMLTIIGQTPGIKTLVLESSIEFIDDATLQDVTGVLNGTHVDLGIGLESIDPTVRALCVNKSHTVKDVEDTAQVVRRHMDLLTYILVKPNFLTELEGIEDSIATAKYAASIGARYLAIEPISLGDYNLSGMLFKAGLYRPVWLWSVIEVVKEAHATGKEVIVGGYQFAPRYERLAQNCLKCTPMVKKAIQHYNYTNDLDVLAPLDCECKEEWRQELDRPYSTLLERIPDALGRLNAYLDEVESV